MHALRISVVALGNHREAIPGVADQLDACVITHVLVSMVDGGKREAVVEATARPYGLSKRLPVP